MPFIIEVTASAARFANRWLLRDDWYIVAEELGLETGIRGTRYWRENSLSFWDDTSLVQNSATDAELLQAISRISTYSTEARYVWRGQPDLRWTLNPGLVRRLSEQRRWNGPLTESQLRGYEMQLLERARAAGYGRTIGEVELLAILQHHGAATRLLDVSSDPMVALWFAVENQALQETDGGLFAINISRAEPIPGTERRSWSDILEEMNPNVVGFYSPPGADERIKVQRGCFVFSKIAKSEHDELSLPIDINNWDEARRKSFFGQPRRSGRPVPPSILVLKIPAAIKSRLLRLLKNSYGYTSETMFPDLGGFAAANGWLKPLPPDRRLTVELTEAFLPVEIRVRKGTSSEASFKTWSSDHLLGAALRELSISAKRIKSWQKKPTSGPKYWAACHATEVVGVFEIEKGSWISSGSNRYTCRLLTTEDPEALAVLGCSFLYDGKPIEISGRAFYANHLKPRV